VPGRPPAPARKLDSDDSDDSDDPDDPRDAHDLWEARCTTSRRIWSGRPNDALVLVVEGPALAGTAPGTALDLGCGEGADAVWLASRGWRVRGVDVADTALARGREHAADAGVADRTTFAEHDLGVDRPAGTFDLVTASFLHSTAFLDRVRVLRSAAPRSRSGARCSSWVTRTCPRGPTSRPGPIPVCPAPRRSSPTWPRGRSRSCAATCCRGPRPGPPARDPTPTGKGPRRSSCTTGSCTSAGCPDGGREGDGR